MLHVFITNIMRCQLVELQDSWQFIIIFWMAWNLTGQGSWQFIYYMFKIHTFCIDPLIRHMKYIFIYIYIYIYHGVYFPFLMITLRFHLSFLDPPK